MRARERTRGHPEGQLRAHPLPHSPPSPGAVVGEVEACPQHQLCHLHNEGIRSQETGKRAEMRTGDCCEVPPQPQEEGGLHR